MRAGWLVALVAGFAAGPLAGQHADGAGDCELCHAPHRPGEAYLLVAGQPGPAQAAPLDAASRTCLRCHTTPSLRRRQPEFTGEAPPTSIPAHYLGVDLSGGHPLGAPDRGRLLSPVRAWRDPRLGPDRSGEWAVELKCTTCHDPHARSGPLPDGERLRSVCTGCHDRGRYELRHAAVPCADCHELHGAGAGLLKGPTAEALCRSCHDRGTPFLAPRVASPGHPGNRSCSGCHAVHR